MRNAISARSQGTSPQANSDSALAIVVPTARGVAFGAANHVRVICIFEYLPPRVPIRENMQFRRVTP